MPQSSSDRPNFLLCQILAKVMQKYLWMCYLIQILVRTFGERMSKGDEVSLTWKGKTLGKQVGVLEPDHAISIVDT